MAMKLALFAFLLLPITSLAMDAEDRALFSYPGARECLRELQQKAKKADRLVKSKEVSAWIVYDETNDQMNCIYWPETTKENSFWRGPIPENTVANIHSHPERRQRGVSPEDVIAATQTQLPFYALGSHGKWIRKALPGMNKRFKGLKVGPGSVKSLLQQFSSAQNGKNSL